MVASASVLSNYLTDPSKQSACGFEQNRNPNTYPQGEGKQNHILPVAQHAMVNQESCQHQSYQPGEEPRQSVQDIQNCLQQTQNTSNGIFSSNIEISTTPMAFPPF